jgi:hypothetical protein
MYTLTVRTEAKVKKERHAQLAPALAAVERVAQRLAEDSTARPAGGGLIRRIEPVQQVVGRIELAGPNGLRAGVDVRGDGSCEAFTGRVRRRLIEQRPGESAVGALRRVLS